MPKSNEGSEQFVPRMAWASDCCLRIELGSDTSGAAHRRVRECFERLRAARIPGLLSVTPAYCTVLVTFDPGGLDAGAAEGTVAKALGAKAPAGATEPVRTVEIPVCYEPPFAPDLEELARLRGLAAEQVVSMHSGAAYTVRFLGFVPGFAYLGGLPGALATPRLERPRTRVPAGSVGIAGEQTGVYPFETPGGWRLIGRTPLAMFDAGRERASVLSMGDTVRFVPITGAQFGALAAEGR